MNNNIEPAELARYMAKLACNVENHSLANHLAKLSSRLESVNMPFGIDWNDFDHKDKKFILKCAELYFEK